MTQYVFKLPHPWCLSWSDHRPHFSLTDVLYLSVDELRHFLVAEPFHNPSWSLLRCIILLAVLNLQWGQFRNKTRRTPCCRCLSPPHSCRSISSLLDSNSHRYALALLCHSPMRHDEVCQALSINKLDHISHCVSLLNSWIVVPRLKNRLLRSQQHVESHLWDIWTGWWFGCSLP